MVLRESVSVSPISPVQARRRITIAREVFARLIGSIKPAAILLSTLLFALTVASGGDFIQTLTPEKIRTAGLAKLTPEELGQLEVLVQQYKAGSPITTQTVAPTTAEVQPVIPATKSASKLPAWVGALLTLEQTSRRADKSEAMDSRIKGDFEGWSGRTTFRLENGQLWAQVNNDSYTYSPTLHSPKVKIYPASLGTFWLEIEGVNQRCRVRPTKLE